MAETRDESQMTVLAKENQTSFGKKTQQVSTPKKVKHLFPRN